MNPDETKTELETLLGKLLIEKPEISVESTPERTLLKIESKDGPLLIGSGGETLYALNYILRKIMERKSGVEETIIIDVNDFRKSAEERVKGIATMLGERVLTFKHEVQMDPMPSFERRVIHSVFQDHPNIVTQSEGFGKFRHVILKYVEQKDASPVTQNL